MTSCTDRIEPVAAAHERHRSLEGLARWIRPLAKFVSVQVCVQVLTAFTGIVIVRAMRRNEYGYYTVANTVQATMLLMADVGVASALSSRGGKVWQDRLRFSELIQAGLFVRRRLAVASVCLAAPMLVWLLVRNGSGVIYAVLLTFATLIGVNFRLTSDVLRVVPQLKSRWDQLQRVDLAGTVARLAFIGVACITLLNAAIGVLIGSLTIALQTRMLRHWTKPEIDFTATPQRDDLEHISRVIRQQLPNTLYYCFQGQLIVFLISVFGNVRRVAELGALGRLAAVFGIVGVVMTNILLPRFARCQDAGRLKRMYVQIIAGFIVLSAILVGAAILAPGPLLWILGKQYGNLRQELVFVVFQSVVAATAGSIYTINASRAWLKGVWLSIPITTVGQVLLLPWLDLGTIKGVALFASLPLLPGAAPCLYRAAREIRSMQAAEQ